MFNGLVTFPCGEVNIGDGGVVVQLVEVFSRPFADGVFAGQDPERSQGLFLNGLGTGLALQGIGIKIQRIGNRATGLESAVQAVIQIIGSAARAGHRHGIVTGGFIRHEAVQLFAILKRTLGLAEQMEGRVPAAGHAYEVAVQGFRCAGKIGAGIVELGNAHPLDLSLFVFDRANSRIFTYPDAGIAAAAGQLSGNGRPHIDNGYFGAGLPGVQCGFISAVIVGNQDDIASGQHRKAVDIGAYGACQHNARSIAVGKYQRSLHRACGHDHLLGANLPQSFLGALGRVLAAQVLADAFVGHQEVVVEISGYRSAGQQGDVVHAGQGFHGFLDPGHGWGIVNQCAFTKQGAAEFGLLVHQHHTGTGLACREGCL